MRSFFGGRLRRTHPLPQVVLTVSKSAVRLLTEAHVNCMLPADSDYDPCVLRVDWSRPRIRQRITPSSSLQSTEAVFRNLTNRVQRVIGIVPVFALAVTMCISQPTAAQKGNAHSLNQKLEQKTQFRPKAGAPLDQLSEVAKTFDILMGIEWTQSAECKASPADVRSEETVRELLNSIVRFCPAQTLTVDQGIVHVRSRFSRHPHNILNLRLWRFQIKDGNVYDAEHELFLGIDMELHPQKYAGGYNGGYGYPGDDAFSISNITFTGRNIAVRDVLDRIVKANGNSLWVVRLNTASLNPRVPFSRTYNDKEAIVRIWELLPLKELR